jgi:hypothetical protein
VLARLESAAPLLPAVDPLAVVGPQPTPPEAVTGY